MPSKRGKGQAKKVDANRGLDPSPRDMEIYEEVCKGRTLRDVGDQFNLHFTAIFHIRERVAKHLYLKFEKRIKRLKAEQTSSLDHIFREQMTSWEKSKKPPIEEINTVTDEGTSHTVKHKSTCGDTAYITQARGALSDIRSIWNIDKHYEQEGQDALNPAGISREEYQMKVAQAQLAEAQELIAELQTQGSDSE